MDVWVVFGVMVGLVVLFYLVYFIYLIIYKIKHSDQTFWFHVLVKVKQRILYIIFSFLYFVAVREVFASFECFYNNTTLITNAYGLNSTMVNTTLPLTWVSHQLELNMTSNSTVSTAKTLRIYTNQNCPATFYNPFDFPVMFGVSIGFGIVYCVFIPFLLTVLTRNSSRDVIKSNDITDDRLLLKRKRNLLKKRNKKSSENATLIQDTITKEEKKQLKKSIEVDQNILYHKYTHSARNHASGISVMFAPFKSFFRYHGVLSLFERCALCCLVSFLNTRIILQSPITSGVLFIFAIYVLITRPYADLDSSIFSFVLHIVLSFDCLFGYWLLRKAEIPDTMSDMIITDRTADIILYAVNGTALILLILLAFAMPFVRNIWRRLRMGSLINQAVSYASSTSTSANPPSFSKSKKRLSVGKQAPKSVSETSEMDYAYENSYFDINEPTSKQPSMDEIVYLGDTEMKDYNAAITVEIEG